MMAIVRATQAALPATWFEGERRASSISALRASTRTPPYAAIKAAVISYTASQAAMLCEGRHRGEALVDRVSWGELGKAQDRQPEPLQRDPAVDPRSTGWDGRRRWRMLCCSWLRRSRRGYGPGPWQLAGSCCNRTAPGGYFVGSGGTNHSSDVSSRKVKLSWKLQFDRGCGMVEVADGDVLPNVQLEITTTR